MRSTGGRRLIGRDRERAAVAESLAPGAVVTVRGTGGVGKTCLASAVADDWPDGDVRTIELAALAPETSVADAVAAEFGVTPDEAVAAVGEWAAASSPERTLLVLDNAEHVVESARAFVTAVAARDAAPALLVTSRRALAVPGETVVDIHPLAIDDAVALYRERAGDRSADDGEVARLCDLLDRLPLGVELAAGRARTLGPAELLARVDQFATLLVGADPGSRHGSLTPLVRWSYDLLGSDARRLFRLLAVLPGAFDLVTVERLGWAGGVGSPVAALDELVESALVTSEPHGPSRRYALLDTVAVVAAALLDGAGERDDATGSMVAWVLSLADEPWEERVEICTREWTNLVAGVDAAVRSRPDDAARLVASIAPIVSHRGGDRHVDRWAAELVPVVADEVSRARLETSMALIARRRGDADRAWSLVRSALAAVDRLPAGEARLALEDEVVFEAGHIAFASGDLAEAGRLWQRSLDLARSTGNDLSAAYALGELAWLEPDPDRRIELLEQASRHFAGAGRDRDRAVVLVNLSAMLLDLGRVSEAEARVREGAEVAAAAGSQRAEAAAANAAGSVALAAGRVDEAVTHASRAVELYTAIGETVPAARCRANVARALLHAGRVGDAVTAAREAVAGLEGTTLEWLPQALSMAAMVAAAAGDGSTVATSATRLDDLRPRAAARWRARAALLSDDVAAAASALDAVGTVDAVLAGEPLHEDDLLDPTIEVEVAVVRGDLDVAARLADAAVAPDATVPLAVLGRPRLAAWAAAIAATRARQGAAGDGEPGTDPTAAPTAVPGAGPAVARAAESAVEAVAAAARTGSIFVRAEVVSVAAVVEAATGHATPADSAFDAGAAARHRLGLAAPVAAAALLGDVARRRVVTVPVGVSAAELLDRAEQHVLDALQGRAAQPVPTPPAPSAAAFLRRGRAWEITFAGSTVTVPDAKGLRDIARLVAEPGRELAAVDLAATGGSGRGDRGRPDLAPLVDPEARAKLRARVEELRAEAAAGRARGDGTAVARAESELDAIAGYLARATGLGGRDRGFGGDAERARKAVTNRIRDVVARLEEVHPELGRHLRHGIRTGTFCRYEPERPVTWTVVP